VSGRVPADDDREVFLEYVVLGASAKVSAIDAETGVEVAAAGPASAPRFELERIALAKLRRRLEGGAEGEGSEELDADGRGGLIV